MSLTDSVHKSTDKVLDFGASLAASGATSLPFYVSLRNVTRQVKTGRKQRVTQLDDISLYFKPGTMTLILGAPGCGKTTLFKVLANHRSKRKHPQTGEVLFNERPPNRKTHHQSVAYVTQDDVHFPTLTVRETFQFSLDCQAPATMPEQAKQDRVDLLLRLLDLKHVENTYVGNDLIRGISGGQKKRVTIGVALTSSPSLILMDEPSTGLDANTALEVISSIRSVCDNLQTPVIASLLQPSPEICNLFDNLIILSKGRVAYFGPYINAIPYFARYGLRGGNFQSDPEFLQEVVECAHKYSDKTTDQLIELYKTSPEYQEVMNILGPEMPTGGATQTAGIDVGHTYPTSFIQQVKLNLKREAIMNRRDLATLRSRFMKKIVMGIIAGSLFYQLPFQQSGLHTRVSILFFANLFLALGNVGIIVPFYRDRAVFYVQREHKYYSPLSYFLSKTVFEIPLVVLECIIFGCIVYWMVGLYKEAERFIFFLLMLMASDLFSIMYCRCMSTFVATEQVAAALVPATFGTMVMFSGFVIPPPSIPDWWIWIYYLSPFHYALEGCLINEFVGNKFHCAPSELLPPAAIPDFNLPYPDGFEGNTVCPFTEGEQELRYLKMHTDMGWRWIHLIIVLGYSLFFIFLTFVGAVKVNHAGKTIKGSKSGKVPSVKFDVKMEKMASEGKGIGAFLAWENLSYAVDVKKGKTVERLTLLDGINGYVRPGMLMALMGPSGAGKSTLLDVLANRKTGGHTEGKILINGAPRDQYFNRFTAYVEQQDVLMPLATVYETVLFSAQVRLPDTLSKNDIDERIKDALHILDLDPIQNVLAAALSMEQRKRLTIAVELVCDPQLLFLDEPTSGLDSQAAMKVMEVIKRVADTGRAVICTIHQPSLAVFTYFDYLLLLKRGGKTVYFGPMGDNCSAVLDYFSSIGWQCEEKRNPADFILDAAAITEENDPRLIRDKQQDPEYAFNASRLKTDMESGLHDIPPGFVAPLYDRKYASTFARQVRCNLKREWANVRRRTQDLRARGMRGVMMGIIIGTLYLQLGHTQSGATDRFGLLFFVLIIVGTSNNVAVPSVVGGRSVFYREQAAGAYRPIAYLIGIVVTEIPVSLITSFILAVLTYWISGLVPDAPHFFFYAWTLFIYSSLSMAAVVFLSLATPNGEIAQALTGLFTSIFALFAGFIIQRGSIPNYWIWMYYLNLVHYPLESLVVNEMEGNWFGCPGGKGAVLVPIHGKNVTKEFCPITTGETMMQSVEFHAENKYPDMAITLGMWAAMVIASFLALTFIRHIKR